MDECDILLTRKDLVQWFPTGYTLPPRRYEKAVAKIISPGAFKSIGKKILYHQFIMIMKLFLTSAEYTNTRFQNSVAVIK